MKHFKNKLVFFSFAVALILGFIFVATKTQASYSAPSTRQQDKTQIERDLSNYFIKSNLIWLDGTRTERTVREGGRLSFTIEGKSWEIVLRQNDLRAPNYRAEQTTKGGLRVSVGMNDVQTFKGYVVGLENAEARFNLDGKTIEGAIFTDYGKYFLEPASRYSKLASNTDYVFYSEKDLIEKEIGSCAASLSVRANQTSKEFLPESQQENIAAIKIAEVATEADNEYVAALGGSTQANNSILNILNVVQGLYERDLNLRLSVVYQHTWDTSVSDPYEGTDPNTMLIQFRNHWNANFTAIHRDLTHLWTGRTMNGGIVGFAYIGTICNNPTFAYGISQKFDFEPNKFFITAHEIAHNFNASHADGQPGCSHTIMESAVWFDATGFCPFSQTEVSNHIAANPSCLANVGKTRFDADGDNKADLRVYRPSGGLWYTQKSSNGAVTVDQFGIQEDKPVPEDFDGDGKSDIAVWRPSNGAWYLINSSNGSFNAYQFGSTADVPVPADYNGDGKAELTIFRPNGGLWYSLNNLGGFSVRQFGASGDIPVPADFDGDAKADLVVFRPSTGLWYVQNSSNGAVSVTAFGSAGDKPIAADRDGDARADFFIFRPSTGVWYLQNSVTNVFTVYQFGLNSDQPVAADYDGDNKTDLGIFRPDGGLWYLFYTTNGSIEVKQFGSNGDIAAPAAYVQ